MTATDTVRAAFQVLTEHKDKPLSEKVRLLENEVKPLSARIADALKRHLVALPVVLLAVVGCGWPPPPETVSIDPAFSEIERAAILDGLDQWCESVEWCPRIVARGAEGRIVVDESVLDGTTKVVNGKPIVYLAPRTLAAGGENDLWRVAIHEIGHFGADHNDSGIMAEVGALPYRGLLCLDDAAVQLWCAAQSCSFTRGTCSTDAPKPKPLEE